MRWILIDEFKYIYKGSHAKGVRNVTRCEPALTDRHPSVPVMPSSLLIEMMAQVTGVLVGATIDFKKEVVLAKVSDAAFYDRVWAPAQLEIEGKLISLNDSAACCEASVTLRNKPVVRAVIFFGLFDFLMPGAQHSAVFSKDFMESFAIQKIADRTDVAAGRPQVQGSPK